MVNCVAVTLYLPCILMFCESRLSALTCLRRLRVTLTSLGCRSLTLNDWLSVLTRDPVILRLRNPLLLTRLVTLRLTSVSVIRYVLRRLRKVNMVRMCRPRGRVPLLVLLCVNVMTRQEDTAFKL